MATSEARRDIRWNFMTVLEYLDFADDIAQLSSKIQDLNDKTKNVIKEAERVGLKLNAKKCKTLPTKKQGMKITSRLVMRKWKM